MKRIYTKARAKINLTLEVLNKRKDGYHNIESIFQRINLYDEMWIEKQEKQGIIIHSNVESLTCDTNTIHKAYSLIKKQYKDITGVKVYLKKNIPIGSGLGGGSADAASFIICLNKLFELNMNDKVIENIAKCVGADVVPCLYKGAILVRGIGEKVEKIIQGKKYYVLIIVPNFFCNTKDMYMKLDNTLQNLKNNDYVVVQALENNDIKLLSNNLYNTFENVIQHQDIIQKIKNELIKEHALGVSLTGSGSCVYGIFDDKTSIKNAYKNLKDKYKTFICITY